MAQILKLVEEPMRRQKRSRLKYWDAVTYLDQVGIPDPLGGFICSELEQVACANAAGT